MHRLVPIFFLMLSCSLPAQTVINTEDLRLQDEDKAFVGLLDADFGMTRNKAGLYLKPRADLRMEYRRDQSKFILLSAYQLTRFSKLNNPGSLPQNFTNRGFVHLRYNLELSDKVIWEAFGQTQFDEVQEIDMRFLTGTGPRFQLLQTDSAYAYLGTLYMYEYEETSDVEKVFSKHHRFSFYLSGGLDFNDFVGISNTTYFQPRMDKFSDFRVSTVTRLIARISQQLSFSIRLEFLYDSRPPVTVPLQMYDMAAGMSYQF